MKGILVAVIVAGVAAFGAGVKVVRSASAQTPICRRGTEQTPAEIERRRVAIALVREINNAQAAFFPTHNRYGNVDDLAGVEALSTGTFETSVVAAGKQYSILVRDTSDPCGYTLFSNEGGVIFIGAPMQ